MQSDYVYCDLNRGSDIVNLIFDLTGDRGFIAGGFARWCLSPLENPVVPDDIDIFCENENTFNDIILRFKSNPKIVYKSSSEIEYKFEYSINEGFNRSVYRIQVIRPTEVLNMVTDGDLIRVLDNFDFTIAKCAIMPNACYSHVDFESNENDMALVLTNIHCPISSAKRIIKYCNRGYKISSAELLKLFQDYEARSSEWKKLISDGLTGVLKLDDMNKFAQAMYLD